MTVLRFRPQPRPYVPLTITPPAETCATCDGAAELCPTCEADWLTCECETTELIPCPDCPEGIALAERTGQKVEDC